MSDGLSDYRRMYGGPIVPRRTPYYAHVDPTPERWVWLGSDMPQFVRASAAPDEDAPYAFWLGKER